VGLTRAITIAVLLAVGSGCAARRSPAGAAGADPGPSRMPATPRPPGCTVLVQVPAEAEVRLPPDHFGVWGTVVPAVGGARCLLGVVAHGPRAADARLWWSIDAPSTEVGSLRCDAAGWSSPVVSFEPGAALPAGAHVSMYRDIHEVGPRVVTWTPCP
jgi:hypothetical protein